MTNEVKRERERRLSAERSKRWYAANREKALERARLSRERHKARGESCLLEGCDRPSAWGGSPCQMHVKRMAISGEYGSAASVRNPGQPYITPNGYLKVTTKGYPGGVYVHRLTMEQILGRPLRKEETVHHIDGDRLNNEPSNLELWSSSHPPGQRVSDKLTWAKQIIELYGEESNAPND